MSPRGYGNPNFGNFEGQNVIWVLVSWLGTKYIIRGKVMVSLKSGPWWILWIRVCPWLVHAPKVFKLHINQLIVWFLHVRVSNWCLSLFLITISELYQAPPPPKCCEPRSMPQLLTLFLFSPYTHIWVYQRAWECITYHIRNSCILVLTKIFHVKRLCLNVQFIYNLHFI
jgi:hypothetical protein